MAGERLPGMYLSPRFRREEALPTSHLVSVEHPVIGADKQAWIRTSNHILKSRET